MKHFPNIFKIFDRDAIKVDIDHPGIKEELTPSPPIVLIHGAHQSNVTFEYFRHALPGFTYINIDWSPTGGFYNNLKEMVEAVKSAGPVYLVGHSMGAIYAAHLSQYVECIGGAAISAPWGGSRQADWLKYFAPNYPLYREVGSRSPIIRHARNVMLPGHWINYVSTIGNIPGMGANNDCVLTINSMVARKDIPTKFVSATHYEIVMSHTVISSIGKNYIRAAEQSAEQYHKSEQEQGVDKDVESDPDRGNC